MHYLPLPKTTSGRPGDHGNVNSSCTTVYSITPMKIKRRGTKLAKRSFILSSNLVMLYLQAFIVTCQ